MNLRQVTVAAAMAAAFSAHAAPLVLTGLDYVTYGNTNSYALPVDGIKIPSSPGQIKDLVVIYTGAAGADVTTNAAGFDDSYQTPNGSQDTYSSIGENLGIVDPGNKAGINQNDSRTWDASLSAMKSFLNGGDAVFLFNNNDTKSDAELAAWAKVWITNPDGSVYQNRWLYLSNEGSAYGLGGAFNGDATTYNPGDVVPAAVQSKAGTDFVRSGTPINGIDLNIGADSVAYAMSVPVLNQWFGTLFGQANVADYTLHLDLRLGCSTAWSDGCDAVAIDNGFEQLFLTSTGADLVVPEPAGIALTGIALMGLALASRRRRSA